MSENRLVVKMTDQPPVLVDRKEWPILCTGCAESHDGVVKAQAVHTMTAFIRVRKHADERVLVYGEADFESAHSTEPNVYLNAGIMLDPGDDVVSGIKRVRDHLLDALKESCCCEEAIMASHIKEAARDCVQSLPPVKV